MTVSEQLSRSEMLYEQRQAKKREVFDRIYAFFDKEENACLGDELEYHLSLYDDEEDMDEKYRLLEVIEKILDGLNA